MTTADTGWAVNLGIPPSILRTADAGLTWKLVSPPQIFTEDQFSNGYVQPYAFFTDAMHAWVVFSGEGQPVWRTTDGGASWLASEPFSRFPEIYFLDNSVGWLLSNKGEVAPRQYASELYQTVDGGATWHTLIESQDGVLNCQAYSDMAFADHLNGWIVPFCRRPDGGSWLLATQDGGKTWTSIDLPPPSQDPGLFEDPDQCSAQLTSLTVFGPSALAVVQFCNPYLSQDGTSIPSPNFLYTTSDAGLTWRSYPVAENQVTFTSPSSIWLAERTPTGLRIQHSTDGGANWELVKTTFWPGLVFFIDDTLAYAVATPQGIFSVPGNPTPQGVVRVPENFKLVRSTNGCRTWEIIEPTFLP